MEQKIILKKGKEKAIRNRHHWIFSGAIAKLPNLEDGSFCKVYSAEEAYLGYAYINKKVGIVGRMISFDETPPEEAIKTHIKSAITLRLSLFDERTNAYRLVNGEGDQLPGLVVDKYDDILVIQIMTLGMDKLRSLILDVLIETLKPKSIYEKSLHGSRKEEGLGLIERTVYGPEVSTVEIKENGIRFLVSINEGQKTGFFLDQREMRHKIETIARGKNVLNCFSYTGGFSLYALK